MTHIPNNTDYSVDVVMIYEESLGKWKVLVEQGTIKFGQIMTVTPAK